MARKIVDRTAQTDNKVTWKVIKDSMASILREISSMKYKDTIKDGEDKVRQELDEIYENIQQAFRTL